jgi:hypothetical protein
MIRLRFILAGTLKTLIVLAITVGILEGALRLVDPWGAATYAQDMVALRNAYIPDADRRYILPDGTLTLAHWSVITVNGTRSVPASQPAACRIIVVGDSTVFGEGVNDDDTFTNHLAQQFPAVEWRNAGMNGYNLRNVLLAIDALPADGYLYLLNNNDYQDAYHLLSGREYPIVALGYLQFAIKKALKASGHYDPVQYPGWVDAELPRLDRPDVLVVAFDRPFTRYAAQVVPIQFIPSVGLDGVISPANGHPNPDGHRRMAANIAAVADKWLVQVCDGG